MAVIGRTRKLHPPHNPDCTLSNTAMHSTRCWLLCYTDSSQTVLPPHSSRPAGVHTWLYTRQMSSGLHSRKLHIKNSLNSAIRHAPRQSTALPNPGASSQDVLCNAHAVPCAVIQKIMFVPQFYVSHHHRPLRPNRTQPLRSSKPAPWVSAAHSIEGQHLPRRGLMTCPP